jgi:hypothetical protein
MNKVPIWFIVLSVVALLWNLLGAAAVIMNFLLTPEGVATLPPEQQQIYANTPFWASYASLAAVLSGTAGCIALLLKRAWASGLFMLSILALVIQDIGIFVVVDAVTLAGTSVVFMQGLVALIAIGLLLLARMASKRDWIQ